MRTNELSRVNYFADICIFICLCGPNSGLYSVNILWGIQQGQTWALVVHVGMNTLKRSLDVYSYV